MIMASLRLYKAGIKRRRQVLNVREDKVERKLCNMNIISIISETIMNTVWQGFKTLRKNALEIVVNPMLSLDTFQMLIILLPFVAAIVLYAKRRLITYRSLSSQNHRMQMHINSHTLPANKAKSLIDHKHILDELHSATDRCYDKIAAIQCIDLVAYCPHLMNVQSEPYGLTPFHRVCLRGHTCLIEYMLSKGANPILTTKTGENSLCMAVYHFFNNPMKDDFTCLNILYNAGCNFSSNNEWYKTVLKIVTHDNNKKLAEWLMLHASPLKDNVFARCMSVPLMLEKQSEHRKIISSVHQ